MHTSSAPTSTPIFVPWPSYIDHMKPTITLLERADSRDGNASTTWLIAAEAQPCAIP
jgi:hypothetical protein